MTTGRRAALGALAAFPWALPGRGADASEDSLQLLLPFPAIGSPEYIGELPASRAQRGLMAAAPAGPADALARIVARAVEVATGRAVRVGRLPGARGGRACEAAIRDPRIAVLASEALCVHDAVAADAVRRAVDRLDACLPVAVAPYRRVGALLPRPDLPCSVAHAGHGGRGASLAARVASGSAHCREVAFNGGLAALRAVLGGQATQAVLPWPLAREAMASGQARDLGEVGPPGWFALLAAPGSRWTIQVGAIAEALSALAPEPALARLGLAPAQGSARGVREIMLHERREARLSSRREGVGLPAPSSGNPDESIS